MRKRLSALLRQSCASPQSAKRAARRIASGPDSKLKVGVRESVSPSVRYGPEGVEVRSSLDQRPSKVGQRLCECARAFHTPLDRRNFRAAAVASLAASNV